MARSISDSFTLTLSVVLSLPDAQDIPEPVLTGQHLADPDESVDAAMDYALPRDGDPEILRQAQRCLLSYIGWLLDDAPARYPSWAKDELQRAIRRLVEVETAVERACPKLH
jgi:hypothetical protein